MIAKLCVLPGDGIGPEVMAQAQKVLAALPLTVDIVSMPFGGVAIDATGTSLPAETLAAAQSADAILLGAVGGPKWDELPTADRPERGLLALRKALDVFANLRPAITYAPLYDASTLKRHVVEGLDILIVRELTGGIYFGEPRGVHQQNGTRVGINTLRYDEHEIRRVAKVAFALAQQRQRQLTSVDKANVLEATQLWRKVVDETAIDYPDVAVSHMYVDNAAMQLVRAPKQFDVVLTTNMFGDILSDCAAMLTGSIGLLPSASLNAAKRGIYEPVHGSAPDIAGRGIANPLAMIASLAMCLRYTLAQPDYAAVIEQAIAQTLADGVRTADIAADGMPVVDTDTMGDAVCKHVSALLAQHGSAEGQEQKG